MIKSNLLCLLIASILVLQSCSSTQNSVPSGNDYISVLNGEWLLARIYDKPINRATILPKLTLSTTEMKLSGSGGCNQYSGSISELEASRIQFKGIAMTEMACATKHIENEYFDALMAVSTYHVKGEHLTFYNQKGETILAYLKVKPMKTSMQQLHDIWALKKVKGKSIDTSTHAPSLEINLTKMKVFGTDGCNQYSGTIKEVTDTNLVFGPLASTKKMCPDMEIPNKFNAMMQNVSAYRLEGLNLILLDEEGKEVLTFLKVD